ncbi:WG repeat-containing protein, partial [Daejeonella sp.]|uniref:WG repeat-containing protein n=1 Tax=Daejeonella sp. TaxID=2805397 RepID=UPI0037BF1B26
MMEKIIEFIDKNFFFNLYKPELVSDNWDYDAENFKEWDSIHKNKNIDYRNNYYGFVFPSVSSKSDSDFDFGFINEKGEELLEMKFDSASKIVNGISVVKKSNKWFILKVKENIFKEIKYEDVSFFSEGLAVVRNEEGKYGYINEDGIEIIKCKYDDADSFSEGLAKVGNGDFLDKVYGFINEKGDEIIPLKYDFTIESVKEGLICVSSDSNNKYGYLDKKGNVKIPFQFDSAGDFKDGFAKVKIEGKWGYIDYNGKIIITCEFEQASDFSNGLALVRKDYDDYFINNKGENVISCDDYRDIHSFNNNLAAVAKADVYGLNIKWGFIDKKGKLII